jgi:hypothetical protein
MPEVRRAVFLASPHRVQQTPEAILELRRILHLHLAAIENSSY